MNQELRKLVQSACFYWEPKEQDLTGHLGFEELVTEFEALITSHEKALLEQIEAEVIGEDTEGYPGGLLKGEKIENKLRAEQRKALVKIKETTNE